MLFLIMLKLLTSAPVVHAKSMTDCEPLKEWDPLSATCRSLPANEVNLSEFNFRENIFFVGTSEQSTRGRMSLSSPNTVFASYGRTLDQKNYLSLDLTATAERFSFPTSGYPELLQIGEKDEIGRSYIDNQHPRASLLVNLIVSDTVKFENKKNYVKFFAAPRGPSTDGPIPASLRITGFLNPDQPLGYHLAQDVSQSASSVAGFSLHLKSSWLEVSGFNGREPAPTSFDIPINNIDSFSARFVQKINDQVIIMASYARVQNPEVASADALIENRYSASLYNSLAVGSNWAFHNSLIYGLAQNYDQENLTALTEEFLFQDVWSRIWGRAELLQRTPAELQISGGLQDYFSPRWTGAITVGFTRLLIEKFGAQLSTGVSGTVDFIPGEFVNTYGGNPLTAKVFIQVGGDQIFRN